MLNAVSYGVRAVLWFYVKRIRLTTRLVSKVGFWLLSGKWGPQVYETMFMASAYLTIHVVKSWYKSVAEWGIKACWSDLFPSGTQARRPSEESGFTLIAT